MKLQLRSSLLRDRPKALLSALLVTLLSGSGAIYAADPREGAKLYAQHCVNCHGEKGVSPIPGVPNFARGEGLFQPDRVLLQSIKDGKDMMPAYQGLIRDEDILDLIAYIRTLR